jgi:hypothetical protein
VRALVWIRLTSWPLDYKPDLLTAFVLVLPGSQDNRVAARLAERFEDGFVLAYAVEYAEVASLHVSAVRPFAGQVSCFDYG